jgi:hypothetical protein
MLTTYDPVMLLGVAGLLGAAIYLAFRLLDLCEQRRSD